jgi:hypothetical protein
MKNDQTVDGILRRYLMGTIEPEVREDVEKRLFSDDKIFWEQMCLAEDELIDAYVSEDLDEDERRKFEQYFLTTEERRDKLSFAQALKTHVERERERDGARSWNPFRGWLLVPSWAPALAATLLVVIPALIWQNARPATSRDDVSAWLSSGLVRSVGTELERLRVPPDAKLVRLRLEIDAAEYPTYRAALHLVSGEEIWSQNNLTPTAIQGKQAVELTLPAELLPAGDYYVRLRGVSPPRDPVVLDRYDFRVLREPF